MVWKLVLALLVVSFSSCKSVQNTELSESSNVQKLQKGDLRYSVDITKGRINAPTYSSLSLCLYILVDGDKALDVGNFKAPNQAFLECHSNIKKSETFTVRLNEFQDPINRIKALGSYSYVAALGFEGFRNEQSIGMIDRSFAFAKADSDFSTSNTWIGVAKISSEFKDLSFSSGPTPKGEFDTSLVNLGGTITLSTILSQ